MGLSAAWSLPIHLTARTGNRARTRTTTSLVGCTTGTPYSGSVSVSTSETLYAVAGGTGYSDSTVNSAAYQITVPGWSQTFSYDAYGNVTTSGNGQFQPGYTVNNQMQCAAYDADGNATNDCEHQYTWDAYGRPVTIDGGSVVYDAFGRAVEWDKSGTYEQAQYSPTGFLMYVLSGGQSQVKAIVPMPGGTAEVWTPTGAYYRHADWLGSSRIASTATSPTAMYYDAAYAPFGQAYAESGTTDRNFTGKDQDIVSGLYDFPAREYNPLEGRWPSPDPAGLASVDPADPQTWNRYAYVRNSSLKTTDPTGEDGCDVEHGQNCIPGMPSAGNSYDASLGGLPNFDPTLQYIPGGCVTCLPQQDPYNNFLGTTPIAVTNPTSVYDNLSPNTDPTTFLSSFPTTYQYKFTSVPDAGQPYVSQKENDAIQLGEAKCQGQDSSAVAGCIEDAYNGMGAPKSLIGGNWDFYYSGISIEGQQFDPSQLGCFMMRCGAFNSLDFSHNDGTFHVDTANPWFIPVGSIVHSVVDMFLGNTVWSGGIPR